MEISLSACQANELILDKINELIDYFLHKINQHNEEIHPRSPNNNDDESHALYHLF